MNVIFMGTPDFAVPTLQALLDSRHRVVAVVCQPDKPSGRGQHLAAPPVKALAAARGLAVLQPARIRSKDGTRQREFADELRTFAPDVIVVAAYGKIIPREVIDLSPHGCLNVHASLLPKYRGAAPVQWAIINGETRTGISIMQIDEGLDTGDVLATEELEILPDDDARSVANALSVIGAHAIVAVLDAIEAGNPPTPTAQSTMGEPSLAPLLTKEDGRIDWSATTERIICRIQGLKPWPGAHCLLPKGDPLIVLRAEPFADVPDCSEGCKHEGGNHPEPGRVTGVVRGRGFTVATGGGELLVTEVKPAGRGAMSADAAVNGRLLGAGTLLT